jgi:hypothetical protein
MSHREITWPTFRSAPNTTTLMALAFHLMAPTPYISYTRSAAPSTWQQAKQVRLMQPLCCSLFPILTRTQQLQRQPPVLRHSGCGVNPSSMSQQSISAQAHRWCGQMLACLAVHASPAVIDSLQLATANMSCTENLMCAPIKNNSNHAPARSHYHRLCPKHINRYNTWRDIRGMLTCS